MSAASGNELPPDETKLRRQLNEFFDSLVGYVIKADQLMRKVNTFQQENFAEEFPYEHLLFLRIRKIVTELKSQFLLQFETLFKLDERSAVDFKSAQFEDVLTLFDKDPKTFSEAEKGQVLGSFKYLSTELGSARIFSLIFTLLNDPEFKRNMFELAKACSRLNEVLGANPLSLEKSVDTPDPITNEPSSLNMILLNAASGGGNQLVFAFVIPPKFLLLLKEISKIDQKILKKYKIDLSLSKFSDNYAFLIKKISDTSNYVKYEKYNPNIATVLQFIEKSADKLKASSPQHKDQAQQSLSQLLIVLTMLPKIIDRYNLRIPLSSRDKASLKQFIDMYESFILQARKELEASGLKFAEQDAAVIVENKLDEKLRQLLRGLDDREPDKIEEIVRQVKDGYKQIEIIKSQQDEKLGEMIDFSRVEGLISHEFDVRNAEYAINRYLESFIPPAQINFYEAQYLLGFMQKHKLKLTLEAVLVLENVADRNVTVAGKVASKVKKTAATAASMLRRGSRTKKEETSATERPSSPTSPIEKDAKDLYRDAVHILREGIEKHLLAESGDKNYFDDLLACFSADKPIVGDRPSFRSSGSFDKPPLLPSQSTRKSVEALPPIPAARQKNGPPPLPPGKEAAKAMMARIDSAAKQAPPKTVTAPSPVVTSTPVETNPPRRASFVQEQRQKIEDAERKRKEAEAEEARKRRESTNKRSGSFKAPDDDPNRSSGTFQPKSGGKKG